MLYLIHHDSNITILQYGKILYCKSKFFKSTRRYHKNDKSLDDIASTSRRVSPRPRVGSNLERAFADERSDKRRGRPHAVWFTPTTRRAAWKYDALKSESICKKNNVLDLECRPQSHAIEFNQTVNETIRN